MVPQLASGMESVSAKAMNGSISSSASSTKAVPAPTAVDAYAAALPDDPREVLNTIRRLIATSVPGVRESIRYQMPVFTIDGIYLVYVGAWKHHIGFYPIPALPSDLQADIAPYRTKTDTVRFLYKQPIPYGLIGRLIEALVPIRVKESAASEVGPMG